MIELDKPMPCQIGYWDKNPDGGRGKVFWDDPTRIQHGWLYGFGPESTEQGPDTVAIVELENGVFSTFSPNYIKLNEPLGRPVVNEPTHVDSYDDDDIPF